MKSKIQEEGESLSQKKQFEELSKKDLLVEKQFRRITLLYGGKDWRERRGQGISGRIVKVNGEYKVEVEIPQLPGNSVYFEPVADFEINDRLLNRTVIGDNGTEGFIVRILWDHIKFLVE